MKNHITAKVFRYDPDVDKEPYFKEYRIKADEKMSVLVLLDHIQKEKDQTLSFRSYCCGLQMCRSCLMKINHKTKFACLTLVEPGEEIVIEPVSYPDQHIKDLVVHIKE
ncbi:MAG: 2Fe-2S iron-sulfur cluster-binding protein [Desulfatiglandales bacterium]